MHCFFEMLSYLFISFCVPIKLLESVIWYSKVVSVESDFQESNNKSNRFENRKLKFNRSQRTLVILTLTSVNTQWGDIFADVSGVFLTGNLRLHFQKYTSTLKLKELLWNLKILPIMDSVLLQISSCLKFFSQINSQKPLIKTKTPNHS